MQNKKNTFDTIFYYYTPLYFVELTFFIMTV